MQDNKPQVTDLQIEQDVLNNNWSEKIPCNHANIYHYLEKGHFANFISEAQSVVLDVLYDEDSDKFYSLIKGVRCELLDFKYFQMPKIWFEFMQNVYPNYKHEA